MTKIVKAAALALLLAIIPVVAKASAQTQRTNVLIALTFSLTGYEQAYQLGSDGAYNPVAKTTKIANDGIINAIAKQARITNSLADAKLYWRMSWTTNADNITYDTILRIGTEDTVVNNFLTLNFPETVSLVTPTIRGTTNLTEYANCNATLSTAQGSFSLHGLSVRKSASLLYNGKVVENTPIPLSFTTTVAGSGSVGFHQAEWKGTLNGSGQKVELEQLPQ